MSFLFQGIFQTQGSNSGLLHCRQILCCLSHLGIPSSSLFSKSLPRRDTGHSGIYKKECVIITDLIIIVKERHKLLTFIHQLLSLQSWLERGLAGQVRIVSTRNSVRLPAASRVTRSSAQVLGMDQVGSGATQVLGPHQLACRISLLRN